MLSFFVGFFSFSAAACDLITLACEIMVFHSITSFFGVEMMIYAYKVFFFLNGKKRHTALK